MANGKHFGVFLFIPLNSGHKHNVNYYFDVSHAGKSAWYFDDVILITCSKNRL